MLDLHLSNRSRDQADLPNGAGTPNQSKTVGTKSAVDVERLYTCLSKLGNTFFRKALSFFAFQYRLVQGWSKVRLSESLVAHRRNGFILTTAAHACWNKGLKVKDARKCATFCSTYAHAAIPLSKTCAEPTPTCAKTN